MPPRPDPPVRVVRHAGARRMSLRVGAGGARLTVPPRTPDRAIAAFLADSEAWIAARRAALPAPPPPPGDGDALALLDGTLTLRLTLAPGAARARRTGDALICRAPDPGAAARAVEAWYRRAARAETETRARRAAAALGAEVARVRIGDPRSRWGSCSSGGTLTFSWRLMLAPERVLDYVVAHEACHLVRPDHSAAFWALVADAFPGHAEARGWLAEHGARLHDGPAWRTRPA